MTLKKVATHLCLLIAGSLAVHAQNAAPTSGDVTVKLSERIDFATARPLQAVRSVVVSSTNPAVPAGSLAVLQLQNRDGSYVLKLLRLNAAGQVFKTMSQPGVSVGGPPASGQHASLPDGATLRFTFTQQDGSPGTPVQQAAPAAASPAQPAVSRTTSASILKGGTTKDRAHFEIEGVKLGMTLPQLLAVAKASGTPKVTQQPPETAVTFKTADLEFNCVLTKAGVLHLIEVYSIRKTSGANSLSSLQTAETTSRMYKKALDTYGRPDGNEGDVAKWNGADGSSATYSLDGDALEVSAKQ